MDKGQILREVADLIRNVVDLPKLQIDLGTTAENIEAWDSFNHINIVVAVEGHFAIKFHATEIEALKNVGELVDLVQARLSGKR